MLRSLGRLATTLPQVGHSSQVLTRNVTVRTISTVSRRRATVEHAGAFAKAWLKPSGLQPQPTNRWRWLSTKSDDPSEKTLVLGEGSILEEPSSGNVVDAVVAEAKKKGRKKGMPSKSAPKVAPPEKKLSPDDYQALFNFFTRVPALTNKKVVLHLLARLKTLKGKDKPITPKGMASFEGRIRAYMVKQSVAQEDQDTVMKLLVKAIEPMALYHVDSMQRFCDQWAGVTPPIHLDEVVDGILEMTALSENSSIRDHETNVFKLRPHDRTPYSAWLMDLPKYVTERGVQNALRNIGKVVRVELIRGLQKGPEVAERAGRKRRGVTKEAEYYAGGLVYFDTAEALEKALDSSIQLFGVMMGSTLVRVMPAAEMTEMDIVGLPVTLDYDDVVNFLGGEEQGGVLRVGKLKRRYGEKQRFNPPVGCTLKFRSPEDAIRAFEMLSTLRSSNNGRLSLRIERSNDVEQEEEHAHENLSISEFTMLTIPTFYQLAQKVNDPILMDELRFPTLEGMEDSDAEESVDYDDGDAFMLPPDQSDGTD